MLEQPYPFLKLTLDLNTGVRQRFRPNYYTKAIRLISVKVKVVPVLVKQ